MLTKTFVRIQSRLAAEEGATAVEYGLLLLITVAAIGAIVALRNYITPVFAQIQAAITANPINP